MGESFTADITNFCNKTKAKPDQVLRAITLIGLRGVIMKNRVRTGRSRANWRIGIGKPDLRAEYNLFDSSGDLILARRETPKGMPVKVHDTLREQTGNIARATFGQQVFITNNIHYTIWLERKDRGMYLTFQEMSASIIRVVQAINAHGSSARFP